MNRLSTMLTILGMSTAYAETDPLEAGYPECHSVSAAVAQDPLHTNPDDPSVKSDTQTKLCENRHQIMMIHPIEGFTLL